MSTISIDGLPDYKTRLLNSYVLRNDSNINTVLLTNTIDGIVTYEAQIGLSELLRNGNLPEELLIVAEESAKNKIKRDGV
jgi:hypothetical protein